MKTLYITDLDGTFLNNSAQISEYTAENLRKLIDNGLLFSVATARTNATVTEMFADIGLNLPFILMNGVLIFDPLKKESISTFEISKDEAESVLEIYNKYGKTPMLYFLRDGYLEIVYASIDNEYQQGYVNARNNLRDKRFKKCDGNLTVSDTDKLIYMVSLDKKELLSPIFKEIIAENKVCCAFYPDNYTNCNFMECMNKKASKGVAAVELKRILGVDKIIAFGDNLNDLSLFSVADECYAVANACDELKNAATAVIDSNENDGVIRFIMDRFNQK